MFLYLVKQISIYFKREVLTARLLMTKEILLWGLYLPASQIYQVDAGGLGHALTCGIGALLSEIHTHNGMGSAGSTKIRGSGSYLNSLSSVCKVRKGYCP